MLVNWVRRRLGWKIFLSYLVVILVVLAALALAIRAAGPRAFDRRWRIMDSMMAGGEGMMGRTVDARRLLAANFLAALGDSLAVAGIAAFLVAAGASVFISQQVVAPVRQMMRATRRLADGRYDERLPVPGEVARDELGDLAASFNQMAASLEKTEAMRRQLIGDVAHELRTPLTTIKGSVEGLIDGVLPAEPRTYQQISAEVDRLQRLVADLQELSQVEAGAGYPLAPHPAAVEHLVSAMTERLGRQFAEKGVQLVTEVPGDLPPVLADEGRIGQVLLNVVGNALQYTPAGGRVTVTARPQGRQVAIAVADTGIGLEPQDLSLVFSRFYRVDKSRSRAGGGSGIGLTLARHLVEAHGGRITAESPGLGQGSTFTFTLPAAAR
jgi:signal transduction histidine kinase